MWQNANGQIAGADLVAVLERARRARNARVIEAVRADLASEPSRERSLPAT
jgi:hypothetical protein